MKTCRRCRISKPTSEFYVRKCGQVNARCRPCQRAINSEKHFKEYVPRPKAHITRTHKYCPRCDSNRLLSDFFLQSNGKRYGYCTPCQVSRRRDYHLDKYRPYPNILPETKVCPHCEQCLSIFDFSLKPNWTAASHCKRCSVDVATTRKNIVWEANRLVVNEYLRTHPCESCGEPDPRVLDFNHLNDKKTEISKGVRYFSPEALQMEMAKCNVLCANCHRVHTLKTMHRGPWRRPVEELTKPGTRKRADMIRTRANTDRVRALLNGKCCVDCGNDRTIVLEFDHVKGKKVASISQMTERPWKLILREVAKCVPRCVNCHRKKTYKERGFTSRDVA